MLPELVQVGLRPVLPARPFLSAIDMKKNLVDAGLLELESEFLGEVVPVGKNDRLEVVAENEIHNFDNLGIDQRFSAGDRDAAAVRQIPASQDVTFHVV
jgi:hypothetical protein